MTDKEFDKATKLFEKARDAALKLSQYQLWAEDAEPLAEQLEMLVQRMKGA
jgi:hypothetical protein